MLKTLTNFKIFHYLNFLTIIQEKDLAQSQIPLIPDYQTISPQLQLPTNILWNNYEEIYFDNQYQNFQASIMSIYIRIQHSTHIFSDSYYQTNEIEQFNDCVSHQDSKIKQKKKGQKRFKNQNDNDVNQSFENQNNVYQSLENQSPKIKKELSLINQNLIKQIPFKKRKKFTLEY